MCCCQGFAISETLCAGGSGFESSKQQLTHVFKDTQENISNSIRGKDRRFKRSHIRINSHVSTDQRMVFCLYIHIKVRDFLFENTVNSSIKAGNKKESERTSVIR